MTCTFHCWTGDYHAVICPVQIQTESQTNGLNTNKPPFSLNGGHIAFVFLNEKKLVHVPYGKLRYSKKLQLHKQIFL